MGILLKEHDFTTLSIVTDANFDVVDEKKYVIHATGLKIDIQPRIFKRERGRDYYCYSCKIIENEIILNSDYFVGIDWLTQDRYIHVEPKLNSSVTEVFEKVVETNDENISEEKIIQFNQEAESEIKKVTSEKELDVIGMLVEIMSHADLSSHTDNLLLIDWNKPEIPIQQKQDLLTPFLVVKFLNLLKDIAKKGLKKSYYKVQENLPNRVKGKILVGQQIKKNILKNRFTNTVCEYQVFGEDSTENRFLKKVFQFCTQYVENHKNSFKDKNQISWMINYIRPVFEHIGSEINLREIKNYKHNPFFKEYKGAIKTGNLILKRFSYNITKITDERISTPPFWIDMPKMFELFVFSKFLKDNPQLSANNLNYQFGTHGNSLDFLISAGDTKIVVDTKYKLKYNYSQIHEDIRQVAGYSRLIKVREKVGLKKDNNEEIPCLIIYPKPLDKNANESLSIESLLNTKISAYHNVYKIGISLPII